MPQMGHQCRTLPFLLVDTPCSCMLRPSGPCMALWLLQSYSFSKYSAAFLNKWACSLRRRPIINLLQKKSSSPRTWFVLWSWSTFNGLSFGSFRHIQHAPLYFFNMAWYVSSVMPYFFRKYVSRLVSVVFFKVDRPFLNVLLYGLRLSGR